MGSTPVGTFETSMSSVGGLVSAFPFDSYLRLDLATTLDLGWRVPEVRW